jgi:hypothetical protein
LSECPAIGWRRRQIVVLTVRSREPVFISLENATAALFIDVGKCRFENVTDRLPPVAVELNQPQMFDRPKVPRSSADHDPGQRRAPKFRTP